jgi:hypothetical protein
MKMIKRKLQWIWDYYFVSMKREDHYNYMESKYGQQWYDFVDRNYD